MKGFTPALALLLDPILETARPHKLPASALINKKTDHMNTRSFYMEIKGLLDLIDNEENRRPFMFLMADKKPVEKIEYIERLDREAGYCAAAMALYAIQHLARTVWQLADDLFTPDDEGGEQIGLLDEKGVLVGNVHPLIARKYAPGLIPPGGFQDSKAKTITLPAKKDAVTLFIYEMYQISERLDKLPFSFDLIMRFRKLADYVQCDFGVHAAELLIIRHHLTPENLPVIMAEGGYLKEYALGFVETLPKEKLPALMSTPFDKEVMERVTKRIRS